MLINHAISCGKDLHVKINDSLKGQLLWSKDIEVNIKAVALVELSDLRS